MPYLPHYSKSIAMNFSATWFAPIWQHFAHLVLLILLCCTARPALARIRQQAQVVGVVFCLLAVLWSLQASLGSGQLAGMNYHLLGVALGSLMLGTSAMLWLGVGFMWIYAWVWQGGNDWTVLSLNALCLLFPTLAISQLGQMLCRRYLPANLFIYIFLNGFLTAALGMLATGLFIISLLHFSNAFADAPLWSGAFPVFFLMSWGEAFLTGLFTAIFVALQPTLLSTFDDQRYLQRKNQIWQND